MANDCMPHVRVCRCRLARLDPNSGVPNPGANNLYVSNALVKVDAKRNIEAATEIKEFDGCGELALWTRGQPSVKWYDLSIQLLTPDPQMCEMLEGGAVLTAGAAVGYAAPNLGPIDAQHIISMELWVQRISRTTGKQDTTFPWAWYVYPWLQNIISGDDSHAATNMGAMFNAEAYGNDNWFDGPLNDWPAGAATQVRQWIPTKTPPPAQCGYQALVAS